MRALPILAVALLSTACQTGGDPGAVEARGGAVRLVVVPPAAPAGTIPDQVLVNESDQTIGYGQAFDLERQTDDGWKDVRHRCAFTAEALYLDPGQRSAPKPVHPCARVGARMEPGVYRVTRDVDVAEGDDTDDRFLVATFTVG